MTYKEQEKWLLFFFFVRNEQFEVFGLNNITLTLKTPKTTAAVRSEQKFRRSY